MTGPVKIDIAASHKTRLGCSKIAQALGVSQWGTPYQLWEQYTGRAPWPDIGGDLRVALGEPMEDVLRPFVAERIGCELRRDRMKYLHPDLPLVGHLDFRVSKTAPAVIAALGRPAIKRPVLDMKTSLGWGSRHRFGADGTDEVDFSVMLQMQGYLMLTGAELAFVAALIPGPEIRIYPIFADAEIQARIAEGITEFWWHVQNDVPPPITTHDDAARRWPASASKSVVATAATAEMVTELRAVKADIKDLEARESELELLLKQEMGDAESLVGADRRPLCTWKSQNRRALNTKRLRDERPDIADEFTLEKTIRVLRMAGDRK